MKWILASLLFLPAPITASCITPAPAASVMQVGASNLIAALASGTSFFTMTPGKSITLKRISVVVIVAGVAGNGDIWKCGTVSNVLSLTTSAGSVAGTQSTTTGSINVPAGTLTAGWIDTDAVTRPIGNLNCEYEMQ